MDMLNLADAILVVDAIRNPENPGRRTDARRQRNKWVLEHDLGALIIEPPVLTLLNDAG
jgi:hypothetical protein